MTNTAKLTAINVSSACLAWYAAANVVIPGLGIFAVIMISKKWGKLPKDANYLSVISVLVGYSLWLLVGSMVAGIWGALFDVIFLLGLAVWLWFRPGFWPIALLIIHAAALLAVDVQNLAAAEFNSPVHKAVFTHVLLRSAEIISGSWAFWHHVKRDRAEEADLFKQLSERNGQ